MYTNHATDLNTNGNHYTAAVYNINCNNALEQ